MGIVKTLGKIGKGALAIIAPTLARALPGPMGSRAKAIVEAALGLGDSSQDEIEKALAVAHPEILEHLRAADQQFQIEMEKLGVDLEKLYSEDRASARAMQIATRSKTLPALAFVVVSGWIALTGTVLFHPLAPENKGLIDHSLGIMDMALALVLGFYFGSSAGSARKTEMMGGK